jgi:hypothetical protein
MQDIPLLTDSKYHFFISHMIGPTDLLHPSPTPHFKTFQVFLIYCPKRPREYENKNTGKGKKLFSSPKRRDLALEHTQAF